ncbi:uncharacterized protein [Rutidosis leptorrhynchoides]|uniref:uncharacterized protein n=1 Tax=Rutidosis leptorrhynchoides TaxID=125765 RepID=UPI003A99DCEA
MYPRPARNPLAGIIFYPYTCPQTSYIGSRIFHHRYPRHKYKVITKFLANRLSSCIDKVISKEQSAFIKGRQILNGPMVVSELITWCNLKNKRIISFKVNFEKAYDSVSWEFLDNMFVILGFGLRWCNWICMCLCNAKTSILVNGSPTGEFRLFCGLRQGDPISPFLLLIIMEGLHLLLKSKVASGAISRVKVGNSNVNICHLFYVDNAIILLEWNRESLINTLATLNKFHNMSSLKINMAKSHLFGLGVDELQIKAYVQEMGCSKGTFPFTYLGLPIGVNMITVSNWKNKGWLPNNVLRIKVGDGRSVSFRNDNWLGHGPLHVKFGRLYHLDSNKNCKLADRYNVDSWQCDWKCTLTSRNCSLLNELQEDIGNITISSNMDSWQWGVDNDTEFSVSGTRSYLDDCILPTHLTPTKWGTSVAHCVQLLLKMVTMSSSHAQLLWSYGINADFG